MKEGIDIEQGKEELALVSEDDILCKATEADKTEVSFSVEAKTSNNNLMHLLSKDFAR